MMFLFVLVQLGAAVVHE